VQHEATNAYTCMMREGKSPGMQMKPRKQRLPGRSSERRTRIAYKPFSFAKHTNIVFEGKKRI